MHDGAVEALIEWAVAPAPPLPSVRDTGAVAAFLAGLEQGPAVHRAAIRALLVGRGRLLVRLLPGRAAPAAEALAALAQLAYYGDPAVLDALGCPS